MVDLILAIKSKCDHKVKLRSPNPILGKDLGNFHIFENGYPTASDIKFQKYNLIFSM